MAFDEGGCAVEDDFVVECAAGCEDLPLAPREVGCAVLEVWRRLRGEATRAGSET